MSNSLFGFSLLKFAFSLLIITGSIVSFAQITVPLYPMDTSLITPKFAKTKPWASFRVDAADVSVAYYDQNNNYIIKNNAMGIGIPELLDLRTVNLSKPIKVWANVYLSRADFNLLNVEMYSEKPKPTITLDNASYLEDLATFRSIREVANSGLYAYRTQEEIDSIYDWAQAEILHNCKTVFDFYALISKLTHFEGSCHNYTLLPQSYPSYFPNEKIYLPITLKFLNGKLYQNNSNVAIPLGSEILAINGISSTEIIARLSTYYNADGFVTTYSNSIGFERGMADKFLIEFGNNTQYVIKYENNHQIKQISLSGLNETAFNLLQKQRHSAQLDNTLKKNKFSFTKLRAHLYQLSIRSFDFAATQQDSTYKAFVQMMDSAIDILNTDTANRLILDLRYNTGGAGFLYEKAYAYFASQPFRDGHFSYASFNEVPYPDDLLLSSFLIANGITDTASINLALKERFSAPTNGRCYLKDTYNPLLFPNEKVYNGQIILLVNEYVASAGAHFASLLKSYTNCIVLGTETSGGYYVHNGHIPLVYQLPNTRIQTGFSIVNVTQDAKLLADQPKGSGIRPHITLDIPLQDFLEGKDTYIQYIKDNY